MSKDLSTRVAELFSPKPWKHELAGDTSYDAEVRCGKCKVLMYERKTDCMEDWWLDEHKLPCTIPDPIDITDIGKALECYRGLKDTSKVKYYKICRQVYPYQVLADENSLEQMACFKEWLLEEATAEQIWEICCLAKESKSI